MEQVQKFDCLNSVVMSILLLLLGAKKPNQFGERWDLAPTKTLTMKTENKFTITICLQRK